MLPVIQYYSLHSARQQKAAFTGNRREEKAENKRGWETGGGVWGGGARDHEDVAHAETTSALIFRASPMVWLMETVCVFRSFRHPVWTFCFFLFASSSSSSSFWEVFFPPNFVCVCVCVCVRACE